jgi:hypothetical protein
LSRFAPCAFLSSVETNLKKHLKLIKKSVNHLNIV